MPQPEVREASECDVLPRFIDGKLVLFVFIHIFARRAKINLSLKPIAGAMKLIERSHVWLEFNYFSKQTIECCIGGRDEWARCNGAKERIAELMMSVSSVIAERPHWRLPLFCLFVCSLGARNASGAAKNGECHWYRKGSEWTRSEDNSEKT